ncbi:UvrD-helicase domain-containing protein [Bacteroides uniformis]|uniref:UvrD-helicase domain-containing protein n=2 Tax=Bacteroides TaxID=816 RepID=UPI00232D8820|nr:UvrD-helicase domain-containing protein [Bacteroides uniformis]MDC1770960.1 UvrD-helicase domain-containing protein [Bacteroides uniformis]MDC1777840.1 UvrD-helicase domain-containing protein [Bacteroides uniformis]MDC1778925.1 UvrD-helicase domain-containing protein [Bacteroides uniformis]
MENNIDFQVDETLEKCILSTPRKSFFLFAGAGSGKTYSLVFLLKKIHNSIGKDLLLQGKNVAVITFTNAATDEIINRLDYSPIFHISTIHSFVWDVIKYYQADIKRLYCFYIEEDLKALEKKLEETEKKTTKTYLSNVEKFEYQKERLAKAQIIEKFVYNPNGSNPEYNALKHAEVIKISAQMILENKMLQRIIAQRYPILLIDESQDTKKELIDTFFEIQRNFADIFTLGLLGDQKQRIYADGKENIEDSIPIGWEKPVKRMNYRCAKRIIQLANNIGKDIDIHAEQRPREDANDGLIRLFVIQQREGLNKDEIEQNVMRIMSEQTQDAKWTTIGTEVKVLTLEHMMAARRLGFSRFFAPLYKVSKYQMTFLQGSVSEIEFFTKEVLPIAESIKEDGRVALEILKKYSPLLSGQNTEKPYELYLKCREEAIKVANLVNENGTIRVVVDEIIKSQLLTVPDVVRQAYMLSPSDIEDTVEEELRAWVEVMDLPINMVRSYDDYVNHRSQFDTHQGVKGLEFDRVMVIIDDSEIKGFLFSYDKLFGVKDLSNVDLKNRENGKETSIERTQRLFYVTCTRAKNSLAVVMYTNNPERVKTETIRKGWFEENEIIVM